ncbi:MAG: adenine phosphoribosyltransferase [Candidatus Thermoplasmatota archaeon]
MTTFETSLRNATVQPRGDYAYLTHPLLDGVPRLQPELLREWTAWAQRQPTLREANLLVAPEAMGLPLAATLSVASGLPSVAARKRSYDLKGQVAVPARTGYGAATLHLNDLGPGDRVVVVDDVLSTGGTLSALLEAIPQTGARAVGALVAVDKGSARPALVQRFGIPIHAWATVQVGPAGLTILNTT